MINLSVLYMCLCFTGYCCKYSCYCEFYLINKCSLIHLSLVRKSQKQHTLPGIVCF